jgi:hypothetical protein
LKIPMLALCAARRARRMSNAYSIFGRSYRGMASSAGAIVSMINVAPGM